MSEARLTATSFVPLCQWYRQLRLGAWLVSEPGRPPRGTFAPRQGRGRGGISLRLASLGPRVLYSLPGKRTKPLECVGKCEALDMHTTSECREREPHSRNSRQGGGLRSGTGPCRPCCAAHAAAQSRPRRPGPLRFEPLHAPERDVDKRGIVTSLLQQERPCHHTRVC